MLRLLIWEPQFEKQGAKGSFINGKMRGLLLSDKGEAEVERAMGVSGGTQSSAGY